MVKRVTIDQIREVYRAKDLAVCVDLLYKYIEQNPNIKKQIIEKASNRLVKGLVDYREISLSDTISSAAKKEDKNEKDSL